MRLSWPCPVRVLVAVWPENRRVSQRLAHCQLQGCRSSKVCKYTLWMLVKPCFLPLALWLGKDWSPWRLQYLGGLQTTLVHLHMDFELVACGLLNWGHANFPAPGLAKKVQETCQRQARLRRCKTTLCGESVILCTRILYPGRRQGSAYHVLTSVILSFQPPHPG